MKPPTVVAIDNDDAFRAYLRIVLSRLGFESIEASDGASGWQLIQEVQPRAVISDYGISKMSGYEIWRAMQQDSNLQYTPFILFSALSDVRWWIIDNKEIEELYQYSRRKDSLIRLVEKTNTSRTNLAEALLELFEIADAIRQREGK